MSLAAWLGTLTGGLTVTFIEIRLLERLFGRTQQGAVAAAIVAAIVSTGLYYFGANSREEFLADGWLYSVMAGFWMVIDLFRFAPKDVPP